MDKRIVIENQNKQLLLFEEKQVRHVWDSDTEKFWLSIVDVVAVLTDSVYQTARKYWKVLKGRLIDVADTEQILRLIQSIPSKKVEPLKLWLTQVGREQIDIDLLDFEEDE